GPSDFAIRRDGEALVAGSSGAVTLWDLARSLPVQEYRDPGDWTSSANLAWSADEQQIASSVAWPLARGVFVVIHIWDVDTGAKVRTIYEESIGYSFELAFRPDGAELASGSRLDGKVHFWDTRTGDLLGNVEGERVQYNPVGDLIATAIDSSVWIWDAETKALIRKFEVGGEESELPIAFSPDGALFVAGKDRIIIWNVRDWTEVVSLPIAGGSLRSLQFSPSGKYLASVNGQTILNDGEWIRDYTATLWAIDS
ncbi:MAG: WD40 repeat domain-containing protein, partial [Anaerolineales bacterium]